MEIVWTELPIGPVLVVYSWRRMVAATDWAIRRCRSGLAVAHDVRAAATASPGGEP